MSSLTSTYTPATPYEVQKHDILLSSTTSYQVIDFNGEGSFGKVAKCVNLMKGNQVAVKIHKDNENVSEVIQREIEMLGAIRTLDPDKNNIVNFMEDFRFNDLSCLAFEMLDRSLWDLVEERRWIPLSLNEIRPITQQLMVAFDALKSIGIMHTDLKPDNVMLVNHKDQPFKIKLIDFGLARQVSKVSIGTMMQPSSFRAPEVTLGLTLTEAVDMWGIGCLMAFLYFGRELFPRECSYNLIRSIVHLLGQPEDHLLMSGVYTWAYFSLNDDPHSPGFRLKSPDEFQDETGIPAQFIFTFFDFVENLEDAVRTYPAKKGDIEYDDRMAFLSLLKSTFDLDPERRVTPRESLKNPFLSMVHLENKMDTSSYRDEALQCMILSPLKHLDSSEKTDSSYEKSDPQAIEADSNIESSSSSRSEIITDNSSARDADIESFYDDNSDTEDCSSEDEDRYSDIESYICEESLTDSLSGYDADIENNCEKSSGVESSIDGDPHTSGNNTDVESSVDDDHIRPTRMTCFDNPFFVGEDDNTPVTSYSSDGDNTKTTDPTEPSRHFDEACSEKRLSTPVFCGEDLPQVDHEELQVAHIINEEKFANELQAEKNKNKLLQEELERLCISYQLLIARYEDDGSKIREQADALQHDLYNEILQKKHLQSVFDEATAALQEEREKNKSLQNQLDETTVSLHEVSIRYQTDVIDVKQQADTLRSDLGRELEQKKLLQTTYEELQEAHKRNQETFSAELDAEKDKNRTLKQEMDKTCISHCKIIQKFETDVIMATQQADTFQQEIHNLRAEQEALRQKMAEEITILQQNAFEKERIFGRELDELKTQLSVQISLNLKLSTELKAEREAPQKITGHDDDCEDEPSEQQESIPNEPTKEAEVPEEMQCEQQETISPAPALESQQGAEGNLPQRTAEPPSVWKRVRHFLGLRKPKRWKKKREEEEERG